MDTKYEMLSRAAAMDSKETHESRTRATEIARAFAFGLRDYLEAPDDCIHFAELDEDHRSTGKTDQFEPFLRLGIDLVWYFAVGLHFEPPESRYYQDVVIRYFIQNTTGDPKVGLDSRSERFDPSDPNATPNLYDETYKILLDKFSEPGIPEKQRIGF